ncbi:hypothetical protein V5E97_04380 [Singulisphaera sp. Ch08]|uniref:Amino acid transporter n=1 Tax=Singulisphaera sp. Ch08 TaxID=3120278 RepID=A0AAU7CJT2_9BACT
MNPTRSRTAKAAHSHKGRGSPRIQPPKSLSLAQKSVLLNLGIVVTALPVLSYGGDPRAVLPTLAILAAISVLIWTATFATSSFISVSKIFEAQRTPPQRDPRTEFGVVDEWMDGPL